MGVSPGARSGGGSIFISTPCAGCLPSLSLLMLPRIASQTDLKKPTKQKKTILEIQMKSPML